MRGDVPFLHVIVITFNHILHQQFQAPDQFVDLMAMATVTMVNMDNPG